MIEEKSIDGIKLEICANSLFSALQAQQGGASRVELCQNLENGGTTPSYAQIMLTRKELHIGLHVLVRPRGGDFLYTEEEFQEILSDVLFCKQQGCDGVVVGVLNADGSIDLTRNAILVEQAKPMTVVFHRAFDRCSDPIRALEDIIALGFDRILTSGQRDTAEQGKELIKSLVEKAAQRIEVMPGSGVNETNIRSIIEYTKAKSIHSSAKTVVSSKMTFHNEMISGMDESVLQTSKKAVEALCVRLKKEDR
ncbi:MAG: copper homeostasis protein CutC [Sphingobacterium sp.]|uniref:copper homeostasis protein CutC n=1 Tax=Sphingobacterium sp. JB170 TaxID=1434842 RepID=UPI00097F11D0|nr:copper homeostasis protein CutC [Sphingobacterium sp. JB170]SJN40329.1 Cytoplasmic copper homeostasis protein cutC [Sphingobacterium sp. JB170]